MSNVIALNTTLTSLDSSVAKDYKGEEQKLFTVESLDLPSPYGGIIEGKKGLFVNQENINIVSDKYEVHQPSEIYSQFASVAEATGLEISRVITNPKNGGLLINAFYSDTQIVGEDHKVNLSFYTSHCGKYKTFLTLDMLRIACMNQVPALYRGKERHIFAEKHYKNALDVRLIGDLLEHIPESIQMHNAISEQLKIKPMNANQFAEIFEHHYGLKKEQKQYDSKINNAKNVFVNGRGQSIENSAYKAFQAVTYMNTHMVRNTAMKEENKLTKGSNDSISFMHRLLAA